jgi:hypothetical protein
VDGDMPTGRYLSGLCLRGSIRALQAPLVDIARDAQAVVLPGGKLLGYDLLVLATGGWACVHVRVLVLCFVRTMLCHIFGNMT